MIWNYLFNMFLNGLLVMNKGIFGNITLYIAAYILAVIIVAAAAYLLGSLNFAIIISSTQYKQDIRNYGSNNAGMTNMMRTYGKQAAAATLIGDALKAVVACLIGYVFLGQTGAYIAGLFCILGHIFPVYYKFKGGKGVVTAGITMLMCNPLVFAIILTIFVLIVITTRYISLASIMSMLLYPVLLDAVDPYLRKIFSMEEAPGSIGGVFAVLMACLVVAKHWDNIKRLWKGEENKFSFKKSVKKSELKETEGEQK